MDLCQSFQQLPDDAPLDHNYCMQNSEWVGSEVQRLHAVVGRTEPAEVSVGDHCFQPYECPYYAHCSGGLVKPNHPISDLYRLSQKRREELIATGTETILHIPDDFALSEIQDRIRVAVQSGRPWRAPELKKRLTGVQWPLHYLDFEAFQPALPRFVGTKPYQAIPFQYSLHVKSAPDQPLEHREFLQTDKSDPRPGLIEYLLAAVEKTESIVVYSGYELRMLSELARAFPDRAEKLSALAERLWDLLPIIQKHYYHPEFRGGFSIKSVLPALLPDQGWAGLEVADGRSAVLMYEQALDTDDSEEQARLFSALRDYCWQDTLAMVKTREALLTECQYG